MPEQRRRQLHCRAERGGRGRRRGRRRRRQRATIQRRRRPSAAPGCGKRNIINHSPPDSKITETNECCCCRGERWKGKMRKNFTSSPIMHITRRKSQKSMQKRGRTDADVGSVSGADAGRRTSHEYFREPFFLRRSATQTAAPPCMFHAYRPPVGGRAAGRHSVARGSCVWRQVSRPRGAAGDITIMVLQVRRRAREIPLRFPEGSIAP